mgnify:FL=1
MRNERAKNEEKIRKVRWQYRDEGFEGSLGVYRQLFGYFNVGLRWELNGRLKMGIENRGYPQFNRPAEEYAGPEEAAEKLEEYFGEIDGLVKEQLKDIKERAAEAYRKYVNEELARLKESKEPGGNKDAG